MPPCPDNHQALATPLFSQTFQAAPPPAPAARYLGTLVAVEQPQVSISSLMS